MADLLEALLQIKALGGTPARVAELARRADPARWAVRPGPGRWAPVEVLAHLADAELLLGVRVRLVLTADAPTLPALDLAALAARAGYLGWPPEAALARFASRREETGELLASCSAAELDRVGVHPVRGPVSVADLVALALAHDTDHVGQIAARLGLAAPAAGERGSLAPPPGVS